MNIVCTHAAFRAVIFTDGLLKHFRCANAQAKSCRRHLRLISGVFSLLALLSACSDDSSLTVDNQQAGTGQQTSEKADISGRVLDNNGAPVAGAIVVTTPYGRSFETAADSRRIIETFVTDADGQYLIPQQVLGGYTLKILASGQQPALRSITNIDFLPQNLSNGAIVKHVALTPFPAQNDGDEPAVALFDIEDKKRMTEFLTSKGIRYQSVIGDVANLRASDFNVLVLGLDATVYNAINQLIDNSAVINQFISDGGHIYFGQQNDFSIEGRTMPFLSGERSFVIHTENAPFNDFQSGIVRDADHPLLNAVAFANWSYIEPGQKQLKQNVVFDAAVRSSFNGPNWTVLGTTPAADFTTSAGTVLAEADVIVAEYVDPVSGGHIVVNQAAFYQASFGDVVDANATRLAQNVAAYIKALNQP